MPGINKTVTAENAATLPLGGTEPIRIVQGGNSAKCTVQDIADLGFKNPATTKGDLIVQGASVAGRLGVGTNGFAPLADSSQALGMVWGDPGAALAASLADTTNLAKNAGQIGFNYSLTYVAGTIGAWLKGLATSAGSTFIGFLQAGTGAVTRDLQSKLREQLSITDFGCDPTGATPCDAALQEALDWSATSGGKLTAPAGTFNLATGVTVPILANFEGAGMGLTVFNASAAMTSMLNMNFSTDTVFSPITLSGFTLNGNSLATNGYNLRYAHNTVFSNIYVLNCTNGAQEKDAFLGRRINVRITGCTTGMWLVGSNHSSSHVGCSYTGCTGTQLLVQSSGTANDGNMALSFIGCDIEFGAAGGNGADMLCSDATFSACYLGENISGDVLINRGGNVSVQGGTMFMGYTATTHLVAPIAGKTTVRNAQISGQTYGVLGTLAGSSAAGTALAGKVGFFDISGFFPVGGSSLSALGDVLDYGPQGVVYAPRQGNQWTIEGNNITFSTAVSNNQQTGTVLTAPGPTPLLGARAALSGNAGWQNGKPLYLVLVYQSSKPINVLLSAGAFGGAPTVNLATSLPATSGGVSQTAMCFQVNASTAAYTLLEVVQTSSAVGDTLTILECFLSDGRMLNPGSANVGNIFKC